MWIRLKAAREERRYQRQQALITAWRQAWWTAARYRGIDISGELDELLKEGAPAAQAKSPEAVWGAMLDWAAQTRGCRIEFHDKPVVMQ